MTLAMPELRQRLAIRFPDVEQVDDTVVRFTRKAGDRPFAVYYLDIAANLPATHEALARYQDRVIGKRYFEGRKSLQWSNYLYFLVSKEQLRSDATRKAKELIELDRAYARKCVITEDELENALQPPSVTPTLDVPGTTIFSIWKTKLAEAGLEAAVISDDTIPARLSIIDSPAPQTTTDLADLTSPSTSQQPPFLQAIELTKFRDYPSQRSFRFGKVNLIFGVNGSGKTSLLEAIEYLYCGRNKRNPDSDHDYEINAIFADNSKETANNSRALKVFRDRNLAWYGQPEVRTNNLCLSFSHFNFLDTDAAVALSESNEHLEENLSKLLVGAEASKIWRDMERVHEAVAAKLRELLPRRDQINAEISAINLQLKQPTGIKQESDSIATKLQDMVLQAGWTVPPNNADKLASDLIESLIELDAVARQAAAFDCGVSPVSTNALKKYRDELTKTCDKAEVDLAQLQLFRNEENQFNAALKRCDEAEILANDAERILATGLPSRIEELQTQQKIIELNESLLAGFQDTYLINPPDGDSDATVAQYADLTVARRRAAESALAAAKEEHANFARLRDTALSLAQQLRQIASEILKDTTKPDECPLCHTNLGRDELESRMQSGVDQELESRAQSLLTRINGAEEELRNAILYETAAAWLLKFTERSQPGISMTVGSALSAATSATHALTQAQRRAEPIKNELATFESQGLPPTKLNEIPAALSQLGYPLESWTMECLTQLRATIPEQRSKVSLLLDERRQRADDLQQSIETSLNQPRTDVQALKTAVFQLKERLSTAASLIDRLVTLLDSYPWPGDKSLSELVVAAESIRQVAADCQAALNRELQTKTSLEIASQRKEELQTQLSKLEPQMQRFNNAKLALENIRNEYSLTDAMDESLKRNRTYIETIFSRIHCPAEFACLGSQLTTLVRKSDSAESTLKQISTGQRAAFALAIFLAQNAQLVSAPPVMLIDDPIAHVDDLNSLSFLDYLREVVLTGNRQIVFATASEKLASLFQRKFDFLGDDDFRRYDLHRLN